MLIASSDVVVGVVCVEVAVLRLFSVKQIPVAAHWSLLLAVGLFAWRTGSVVTGAVTAVLLFGSVLLHELGHAMVALRFGLPIAGIDLHVFGGTAKMAEAPRSPREELWVALAGPAVSLALGVAASVGVMVLPTTLSAWLPALSYVAVANVMLFAFNLLPALPMDGGRVLRALLASRKGFVTGTRLAVRVGRVVAVILAVVGVFYDPWLVVMAGFVWMLGRGELAQVEHSVALDRMGLSFRDPWARYRKSASPAGRAQRSGPVVVNSLAPALQPDLIVMADGTQVVLSP